MQYIRLFSNNLNKFANKRFTPVQKLSVCTTTGALSYHLLWNSKFRPVAQAEKAKEDAYATVYKILDKLKTSTKPQIDDNKKPKQKKNIQETTQISNLYMNLMNAMDQAGKYILQEDTIPTLQRKVQAFSCLLQRYTEIKEEEPLFLAKTLESDEGVSCLSKLELKDVKRYWLFANLAYEPRPKIEQQLEDNGFKLLRYDQATGPMSVAYFVCFNPEEKVAVIGVKGTSTMSDLITDLVCSSEANHRLGIDNLRCHQAIGEAAFSITKGVLPLVEHFLIPQGYKVVFSGHSLGAGAAALAGASINAQLKSMNPLKQNPVRVYAYACPAIVDYKSSLSMKPFITTIVNQADVIPRASVANAVIMLKLLHQVDVERMETGGQLPKVSMNETEKKLALIHGQTDLYCQDHLFVPGKALIMYNSTVDGDGRDSVLQDASSQALRVIIPDANMVMDHLAEGYEESLKKL
eukprot:m.49181 g.49181  ORF g.49181 m.49181 type:complete len:464 (-) comp10602_c0_seq1:2470-3861(-)